MNAHSTLDALHVDFTGIWINRDGVVLNLEVRSAFVKCCMS